MKFQGSIIRSICRSNVLIFRSVFQFILSVTLGVALVSCTQNPVQNSGEGSERSTAAVTESVGTKDQAWEVSNDQGETYLSDIYYSADFQNEQVMPTTITTDFKSDGTPDDSKRRYQIDRLIYPTLGNPNLYVREDAQDFLTVVLRVEESAWRTLLADPKSAGKNVSGTAKKFEFKPEFLTGTGSAPHLTFQLVPKSVRNGKAPYAGATCPVVGSGEGKLYSIVPSGIYLRPDASDVVGDDVKGDEAKYFAALNLDGDRNNLGKLTKRSTLEVRFDTTSLLKVCDGLYDIRFELKPATGGGALEEIQYNAVRVFDKIPNGGDYTIVNVTDSQVTVTRKGDEENQIKGAPAGQTLSEKTFEKKTHDRLKAFKDYINVMLKKDPNFKNAAFISFNGDLHNGGSPLTLGTASVADTYNREAIGILAILKDLNLPIFLTMGNHDGYVTMAKMIGIDDKGATKAGDELNALFAAKNNDGRTYSMVNWYQTSMTVSPSPELGLSGEPFSLTSFLNNAEKRKLFAGPLRVKISEDTGEVTPVADSTQGESALGGVPMNIYSGRFARYQTGPSRQTMAKTWIPQPVAKSNLVLFDAFNQWRRTYGPMYSSFKFGKNQFLNLNTYDIRQHRRSGWGMYTVNYGGGLSETQMQWLRKQVDSATKDNRDIVVLAHHDPRGGHNGKNYPYYFRQVAFNGMSQSLVNYVKGEILLPQLCKLPDEAKGTDIFLDCMHDGLQEWMRPDPLFDCVDQSRGVALRRANGTCDTKVMKNSKLHPQYSGYQFIDLLATQGKIRTLLLGHTHYNSVEVKYNIPKGNSYDADALIPDSLYLDKDDNAKKLGELQNVEYANPMRQAVPYLRDVGADLASDAQMKKQQLTAEAQTMVAKAKDLKDKFYTKYFGKTGEGANDPAKPFIAQDTQAYNSHITVEKDTYKSLVSEVTGGENPLTKVDVKDGNTFKQQLHGAGRELVVLRLTSVADLTSQKVGGKAMSGFSVFHVNQDKHRTYSDRQINAITYYRYANANPADYDLVGTYQLNRDARLPFSRLENLIEKDPQRFRPSAGQ